jgi:predicted nucleic acid-binding protein
MFIEWLNHGKPLVEMLKPYLLRDAWILCDLIRCEVLRGIREPAQQERVDTLFSLARTIPMDRSFWNGVGQLGWTLDRKGHVLPLTDLCVAYLAVSTGATLVTRDRHFDVVSDLRRSASLPG